MLKHSRFWRRILAMAIATLILAAFGGNIFAQDAEPADEDVAAEEAVAEEAAVEEAAAEEAPLMAETVQVNLDTTWILVAGMLVFFMQAGFALLEAGLIRQTGVVNSLMENFMDACLGGVIFWIVGYGIAFGVSSGGLFGASNFFLSDMVQFVDGEVVYGGGGGVPEYALFFFQFAFAATAGTIATGAMAERTNYIGKLIYTVVVIAIIYPVVVHWVWGGGWLSQLETPFADFAGSTVVHAVGGIFALCGALVVGSRPGRQWGNPPRPHNLGLATLGTLILWFGWYGFNPGSTLGMGDPGLTGLVTVNTTIAACTGALMTMFFVFFRTRKWDLPYMLNGSLAGLVGITAGCAFVAPWAAFVIGLVAGIVVVLAADVIESLKIDDAVGAFAVHGACGIWGTLAIGLIGQPELGAGGVLLGGGMAQLITQIIGVVAVTIWVGATGLITFSVVKAMGQLRIPEKAEAMGIDAYEHGATVWPDVLAHPDDMPTESGARSTAPAAGD
jgi:Amt family ammonium transporter